MLTFIFSFGNLQSQLNDPFRAQVQHKMAKPDSFKTVLFSNCFQTLRCSHITDSEAFKTPVSCVAFSCCCLMQKMKGIKSWKEILRVYFLDELSQQLVSLTLSTPLMCYCFQVMCKGWLETGGCSFGGNCRFAHGEEELRPTRLDFLKLLWC